MNRVRLFFALHRIFLCELGNSHSSVAFALARFIRTQDDWGDDGMQSTVKGQWHKKV